MIRGFPVIKKLGAINRSGEMTPFVHKGRLMRMELMDPTHGLGTKDETGKCPPVRACIRDVEKNEILSYTGDGCYFYAAYVENDVVYITGVVMEHRDTIRIFASARYSSMLMNTQFFREMRYLLTSSASLK